MQEEVLMDPIDALEKIKRAHIRIFPEIREPDGAIHKELDFKDEFDCLDKAIRALDIIRRKEVILEFFLKAKEVAHYSLLVKMNYNYDKEKYSKFLLTEDEFLLIKEIFHE